MDLFFYMQKQDWGWGQWNWPVMLLPTKNISFISNISERF